MAEYLRVPDVAKRLAVSVYQVRKWIVAGELPAVCVSVSALVRNKQFRVALADLEAFEASRRSASVAAPMPRRRRASYRRIVSAAGVL